MTNFEWLKTLPLEDWIAFIHSQDYTKSYCPWLFQNHDCGGSDCGDCLRAWLTAEHKEDLRNDNKFKNDLPILRA